MPARGSRRFANRRRDVELHADREDPFEDRQRLVHAGLLEVHGGGEHDFADRDALWRIEGQDRRDEQRVAGLVGLDVKTFGQRHLERGTCRPPAGHPVAFEHRCQGGGRGSANLSVHGRWEKRATTEDTEDTEGQT